MANDPAVIRRQRLSVRCNLCEYRWQPPEMWTKCVETDCPVDALVASTVALPATRTPGRAGGGLTPTERRAPPSALRAVADPMVDLRPDPECILDECRFFDGSTVGYEIVCLNPDHCDRICPLEGEFFRRPREGHDLTAAERLHRWLVDTTSARNDRFGRVVDWALAHERDVMDLLADHEALQHRITELEAAGDVVAEELSQWGWGGDRHYVGPRPQERRVLDAVAVWTAVRAPLDASGPGDDGPALDEPLRGLATVEPVEPKRSYSPALQKRITELEAVLSELVEAHGAAEAWRPSLFDRTNAEAARDYRALHARNENAWTAARTALHQDNPQEDA